MLQDKVGVIVGVAEVVRAFTLMVLPLYFANHSGFQQVGGHLKNFIRSEQSEVGQTLANGQQCAHISTHSLQRISTI
jgi:hypothetical protein